MRPFYSPNPTGSRSVDNLHPDSSIYLLEAEELVLPRLITLLFCIKITLWYHLTPRGLRPAGGVSIRPPTATNILQSPFIYNLKTTVLPNLTQRISLIRPPYSPNPTGSRSVDNLHPDTSIYLLETEELVLPGSITLLFA